MQLAFNLKRKHLLGILLCLAVIGNILVILKYPNKISIKNNQIVLNGVPIEQFPSYSHPSQPATPEPLPPPEQEYQRVVKSINPNYTAPRRLMIADYNWIRLINSDGVEDMVTPYETDRIYDTAWSTDGKYISFIHWPSGKEDPISFFGSFKAGLSLISTQSPYELTELIPSGELAYGNIDWSPNSEYISYVINDGQGLEIRKIKNNQVVVSLKTKITKGSYGNASRVTWLDNNSYSYVLDGNYYIGTLNSPRAKLIATNALASHCVFEGPPDPIKPVWSKDARFTSFLKSKTMVVLDTITGRKIEFGKPDNDGFCDGVNINSLGWTSENKFFYTEYSLDKLAMRTSDTLKSIQMPQGKIQIHTTKGPNHQVSPDGKYLAYGDIGVKIINLKTGQEICPDFFAKNDLYSPFGDSSSSWFNNIFLGKDRSGFGLNLVDLSQCKSLAEFSDRTIESALFDPVK
ncbi:hypothetical protein HY224_03315 [Candidatus Uhrbacteria bacterium]|nr:hypothetical protein [Candidatus Uhrbacteria bacterium]